MKILDLYNYKEIINYAMNIDVIIMINLLLNVIDIIINKCLMLAKSYVLLMWTDTIRYDIIH